MQDKELVRTKINNKLPTRKELVEGIDYYVENGYTVFKEVYHLNRGYCCGNGCRYCPYKASEKRS
jgi:hypothetical protein